MSIKTINDFTNRFPTHEWLEDMTASDGKDYIRLSNGLEEGSEHESEWFDLDSEELQDGRPD